MLPVVSGLESKRLVPANPVSESWACVSPLLPQHDRFLSLWCSPLNINTNPRNGQPEFNLSAFTPEALGQMGNAPRRFFYDPGLENVDLTLAKVSRLTEVKTLELRIEAFDAFNHAQFLGPATVDGEINDAHFGEVVSADAPRLIQLVAKFIF